jgi:hypothetical protein
VFLCFGVYVCAFYIERIDFSGDDPPLISLWRRVADKLYRSIVYIDCGVYHFPFDHIPRFLFSRGIFGIYKVSEVSAILDYLICEILALNVRQ